MPKLNELRLGGGPFVTIATALLSFLMKRFLVLALLVSTVACTAEKKDAWRESGQSWGTGGRQFLRALGRSIAGEGSPKEEWKDTGEKFGEAGKDTGQALETTLEIEPRPTPAPEHP